MDLGWCRQHFSDDRVVNVDGCLKENMQNYMPRLTQRPHLTTIKLYFSQRRAFQVRVKFLARKQAQHVSSTSSHWKFNCQNCTANYKRFCPETLRGLSKTDQGGMIVNTSHFTQVGFLKTFRISGSCAWQGNGKGLFCNIYSAHDRHRVKQT